MTSQPRFVPGDTAEQDRANWNRYVYETFMRRILPEIVDPPGEVAWTDTQEASTSD